MKRILLLAVCLAGVAQQTQAQGLRGLIRSAVAPATELPAQSAPMPRQPAAMAPQAVIANAPSLPTPEQWAAGDGHTEAFNAKIEELHDRLGAWAAEGLHRPSQADINDAIGRQERQTEQSDRQLQQMFGISLDEMSNMSDSEIEAGVVPRTRSMQAQAMAGIELQMQVMASLGITEADMMRLENMDDKQAEAYIERRLRENGYTGADLERRLREAGIEQMSDAELAQDERRSRELRAQMDAIDASTNAITAFMEQQQVTNGKIDEARMSVEQRLDALLKEHAPKIAATDPRGLGWEDVMMGAVTEAEYNATMKRMAAAIDEYKVAAYRIWSDYVGTVQGHLKFLMPYAQAADDAGQTQMSIASGLAGTAAGQKGAGMHAVTVAGQYLSVTAGRPDTDWRREIRD